MPLTGGCQCGAVRYAIAGEPLAVYVCHCRECRKQSASAFGISVTVRTSDLHLRQGAVKSWTRDTDSGRRLRCVFCPQCGSRLWHEGEPAGPTVSIKGGSLDEAVDGADAVVLVTAHPGIDHVAIAREAALFVDLRGATRGLLVENLVRL